MKRNVGFFIFLLNCSLLSAQDHPADNLVHQFNQYQSNALQEKLFVHTDKTFYLAGETVWFKVYAVDASWHKPLAASCISYIEILNKDLKPVMEGKIALINGSGNGSLTIPGFLNTGNYIFRAYTNWMKNFPPDFYFEQTIHIVNTLKTAAFTQHPRPAYFDRTPAKLPESMGVSVRTPQARYTEWRDWKTGETLARELYSDSDEPSETRNRIDDPSARSILQEVQRQLQGQFPPLKHP